MAYLAGCGFSSDSEPLSIDQAELLPNGNWAQIEVYGPGDTTAGWDVYDSDPVGATISVVDDAERGRVNRFAGSGTSNGYRLRKSNLAPWANTNNFHISWWMRYSGPVVVYVDVNTSGGQRYLNYTADPSNHLGSVPGYIHHGLGPTATDGAWHGFQRDLKADLRDGDPTLTLLAVNGFLIRGSGLVDDVALSEVPGPVHVYSGDSITGWDIYDNDPPGATMSVADDPERGKVNGFTGAGGSNGYRLRKHNLAPWGNTSSFNISWWMRYSGQVTVYVDVNTSGGQRYLNYTADTTHHLASVPGYIHHGLGPTMSGGAWQVFQRDLKADLRDGDPSLTLLSVNAFLVRGSGLIDNVTLQAAPHVPGPCANATSNPIVVENCRAGTAAWGITKSSPNREVEGYASTTSAAPGDNVHLHIHVSVAQRVRWEAFRLGYYKSLGARLIAAGDIDGIQQPSCPVEATTGAVACQWSPTLTVRPTANWTTGQYLFRLTRADGFQSYIPLVVREAVPRASLVMQASVTTYQAYNSWGGASLYANDSARTGFSGGRAYRVSFDRPYAGNGSGQLLTTEVYMLRWLEMRGYDVAYLTNIDVDSQPNTIQNRNMFLSVGHDEYWTVGERDAVEAARNAGVSLGFFSANTAYWRIRLDPSASGAARRQVTCYKDAALDPLGSGPTATVLFRSEPFARPENALLGVMYESWSPTDGYPLRVTKPNHWLYAGTGVALGDTLPNIGGYEWDHEFSNGHAPAGLERLADMVGIGAVGEQTPGHTVTYAPTASSVVFSSGNIYWAWALSHPNYVDSRVQRMTENVLGKGGVQLAQPTLVSPTPPPVITAAARGTKLVAGDGTPGYQDGPAVTARFAAPAGVVAHPDGTLYVTEARNHRVRAISPSGTVSTLAGCGPTDTTRGRFANGIGTSACFDVPTGVAVSNNVLYVVDSGSSTIRAIDIPTKSVRLYAGAAFQGGHVDAPNPTNARFKQPRGLAIGPEGALYVADSANNAIRRITSSGVTTVAQGLSFPTGVTVASDGTIYVSAQARIVRVPRQNAAEPAVFGPPQVLAGGTLGSQDGIGPAARLRPLEGMVIQLGAQPKLLFSDSANLKVRALDLSGPANVTTIAGTGRYGSGTALPQTSHLVLPRGLCPYQTGFAIADSGNHRIVSMSQ